MGKVSLRVGCIGWGSLLWDPRSLPLTGPFREGGPRLPIEFSRVANDGRVTLVIDPAAAPTPTFWAPLASKTREAAVEGLGRRERIAPGRWSDWIGWQTDDPAGPFGGHALRETRAVIAEWLGRRDLDAAVWTALPSRRPDGVFALPGVDELLLHLRGLEGEALVRAEEYIRRAPAAVRTAHRARFEMEFGWSPSDRPPNPATPGRQE